MVKSDQSPLAYQVRDMMRKQQEMYLNALGGLLESQGIPRRVLLEHGHQITINGPSPSLQEVRDGVRVLGYIRQTMQGNEYRVIPMTPAQYAEEQICLEP